MHPFTHIRFADIKYTKKKERVVKECLECDGIFPISLIFSCAEVVGVNVV